MKSVHATLRINPEIVGKLGSGTGAFWSASHPDGSDNRIDADAVLEAGSYGIPLGILSALFQGIRKKYRNRGKTKEDLLEEKEAAKINRTGGALEEMLLEYIRAAQAGSVDEENLTELIDTLEEIQGYARAGKLKVTGKDELAEIRKSIADFTAAPEEGRTAQQGGFRAEPAEDEFGRIREMLIRQKGELYPE